jgi:hypothetical protein
LIDPAENAGAITSGTVVPPRMKTAIAHPEEIRFLIVTPIKKSLLATAQEYRAINAHSTGERVTKLAAYRTGWRKSPVTDPASATVCLNQTYRP